jgi:tetratricopeptide (TPR) repeat protein
MLDHAERIPEPFRERAPFLLTQAMAYEMVASPWPGPDDRLRIARGKQIAPEWIGAQRRAYRDAAIATFRKVLEREPDNAESAVHLGFLLEAGGKTTEAEAVLRAARRHAREPVLRYYVALLAGRLRQRHGDLAGAGREYVAAAEVVPHGQAAAIARAEVLALSGRRAEAAEVTRELMMRPIGKDAPPADPWLTYPFGQSWKLDALMDELRRSVQTCN